MMIDWICDDMEFDHNSDVNTPQLLEILTHEKTRYLQKALLLNRFEDSKVDRVISDLELQIALCKKNEEHFKNVDRQLGNTLYALPEYKFKKQESLYTFWPKDLELVNYQYSNNIKYLLKE